MYRFLKEQHNSPQDFEIPTEKKLNPHNKWVMLAELIPWEKFEAEYAANFHEKMGAPAKSFRIALASLIIQEISGYTDRQMIENIEENPYLQYFLGPKSYEDKAPFEVSMLVYFRKRINRKIIEEINRKIVKKALEEKEKEENYFQENKQEEKKIKNKGKLMSDASCTRSDITYPTDLG